MVEEDSCSSYTIQNENKGVVLKSGEDFCRTSTLPVEVPKALSEQPHAVSEDFDKVVVSPAVDPIRHINSSSQQPTSSSQGVERSSHQVKKTCCRVS